LYARFASAAIVAKRAGSSAVFQSPAAHYTESQPGYAACAWIAAVKFLVSKKLGHKTTMSAIKSANSPMGRAPTAWVISATILDLASRIRQRA
jgi:hypothetical protein